ncbi:hypothetical protein CNR22_17810 [Sphingobacteriaceae bacterium]|nr:hypothetical protein CNR22_17810 [Sphingobacteriaceae bacterium]
MDRSDILIFVIYTTLIILILTVVLLLSFIISAKRRSRQKNEISNAKLKFERELRQVEAEVSEHIMSQFAQELHDNIGQLLTAMHIQIENQKLEHPDLVEGFKPIEIYLGEVTQHLRLLSRTLNNDYLGHIGLLSALQLEVDRLRALRRFTIHWQGVSGNTNLEKNQELMAFRIFQEITQNALRHASAQNLYITLSLVNGFELRVKDDGKGFDKEAVLASQRASGLRNIMKRSALAGLECEIESSPGNGSLFILKKISTLV